MPDSRKKEPPSKSKRHSTSRFKRAKKYLASVSFSKRYALGALAILLATTIFWSILGAKLQSTNADQLVNPYLMADHSTLQQATLPSAHSFLIKWPIFLLIKVFGYSSASFIFFTVFCSLATVAALAFILYKIDRRPMVFGTLCLALASVLLLVPAQPYPGGLLPVNMAMITTRNLEYIFFIGGLAMMLKSPRLRSRHFWLGAGLLTLVIASDKLFLTLGVGGAMLALVFYALVSNWRLVNVSVRWLIGAIGASALALGVLQLFNAHKVVHLSGQTSPYGLIHSTHDLVLGILYAVAGIMTNFGANPAFSATVVKNVPHQFFSGLFSFRGPAYLVNLVIFAAGAYMIYRLFRIGTQTRVENESKLDLGTKLSLALIWAGIAGLLTFIFTKHDYTVDARYLTIALFALFISAASSLRQKDLKREVLWPAGLVISIGILFGLATSFNNYTKDRDALADINNRNTLVSQAVTHHKVSTLIGDYWRVLPIKQAAGTQLNVIPLASCSEARTVLASKAWQVDLSKRSFAYLLSLDKSLTDYQNCSLDQIIQAYGRPNSSVVIAGSQTQPKELLLFYDNGVHRNNLSTPKTPNNVLPSTLDKLTYTSCPSGTTIMNVVAHQDDDLLFINPDTLSALKSGHCVRTVYITAGDAGGGQFYWLAREQGSEAAYSTMLGSTAAWTSRIVEIAPNEYVEVAHPINDPHASLIFMHLPDGNINGSGFKPYLYQSLTKLEAGKISNIYSVDNQSVYTSAQLTDALTALIHTYQPTEIRSQANFVSNQYPDHSDHMAVGRLVKESYAKYDKEQFENSIQIPLKFYIGYPVHAMPANVSDGDLTAKDAAWFAYAKYDGGVCQNSAQCANTPTYGSYLARQYQNAY